MSDTLWIDIETRSRIDLRKTGVYRYAQCPDFRILMASWSDDGETVQTALEQEEIADIPGLWSPKVTKVAHNAQFERVCFTEFSHQMFPELEGAGYLNPEHWRDTQAIAAELGFPKKLEKLAPALGAEAKDPAGTRLINLFCKPNRKGEWNGPHTHPMEWMDFIAYCEQDVSTLIECDRLLEEYGGWPTQTELEVFLADQRINDRGIPIDVKLAKKAVRAGRKNQEWQKARVTELSGVENPGSVQQMSAWLNAQLPQRLPNLKSETVGKLLEGDLRPDVREVLQLRQELALAAPAKFSAALGAVLPDGRLRGTLAFFGAHTGRWAGRGTQVQNLPRHSFGPDAEGQEELDLMADLGMPKEAIKARADELTEMAQQAVIDDLMADRDATSDDLKRLVRPMFLGPFTVVDYKSIEAIVLAWLAGEEWTLEAFRVGRDIYVETAERMGGLSRSDGKIAVLALGYNGGAGSLRAMAGEGALSKLSDEELYDQYVYPWREANKRIVKLWRLLEARFVNGGAVGHHLRFEKHGKDRLLRLPSGRAISYRKCSTTRQRDQWGRERVRLWFASPQGFRQDTYGGRLAENATQAVARDILAGALVRLEEHGYRVVGHVHDEIIVEGEHDPEHIAKIMCEPPSWADGLPIGGEGFNCDRYKKG